MRHQSRIAAIGALVSGSLLSAAVASAPPIDGNSKVLRLDGKPGLGTQNILVIPVVDSTFAYNPASRTMEGSFPGKLAQIRADYARMAAYWNEASYGIVSLSSEVASCFYKVPVEFPNAGEEPYREAKVVGVPTLIWKTKYSSIVVDYVVDPSQPALKKTFTGDPNLEISSVEDLLTNLNSQLADTDPIEAAFESFAGTGGGFGNVVFRIKAKDSVPGSSISINLVESDRASRIALGLVKPTVTTTTATGRVVVRSESATLPGIMPSGLNIFTLTVADANGATSPYPWAITLPDGSPPPTSCSRNTTCQKWDNAAGLSLVLRPQANMGVIRDAPGPELEFEFDTGRPGIDFVGVESSTSPLMPVLGLESLTSQVGKGFGRDKTPQSAQELTAAALQALLTAELSSTSGCLATEINDIAAPDVNTKSQLDAYMDRYDAIHVLLLTDTNTALRANAWLDPIALDTNLTIGTATFPYQILTDVAAVNLVSGAATIGHETGHNLGFPDLYDISLTYEDYVTDFHPKLSWMGQWDMMADQGKFPHTGAFNKQTFHQWIQGSGDNGKVTVVSPGTDKNYLVTPLEYSRAAYDQGFPAGPDGQPSGPNGAEVVKMLILPFGDEPPAPGQSVPPHFIAIENRQEKVASATDPTPFNAELPGDGGIHVTDNMSDLRYQGADFKPINRQFTHSLTPPVPAGSQNFPRASAPPVTMGSTLDTTQTFPAYPGITINPIMTVPAPDPTKPPSVLVHVAYTTTDRLDLKIEPWNAPKEYATKSIWFERATSATPPVDPPRPDDVGNVNVPIYRDGYDPAANGGVPLNWIHVYVENPGTFDAKDVQLKAWFNSPGGIGDPEYWRELELTDGKDIPAGGHVVFSIPWSPGLDVGSNQHTCIAVEVHNWKVGAFGQVADVNPFNNIAQENVHKMEMKSASPWHDVPFKVEVHNSFAQPVRVQLEPQGLSPGYSVTLDQRGVVLPPKAAQTFTGTLHWDPVKIPMPSTQNPYDPYWQACNVSAMTGVAGPSYCGSTWSVTAYADLGDAHVPLGGVSFETEGKPTATLTSTATNQPNGDILVTGQVLPGYRGQVVRVVVKYPSGRQDTIEVLTFPGGGFALPFPPQERGPIVITTELPRGTWPNAPFAPTEPTEIAIEACAPNTPPPPSPTCQDGLRNGTETGVDCGGLTCPPCGSGVAASLLIESDWGTGYCGVLKVQNFAAQATSSWQVALNLGQSTIFTNWNGSFSGASNTINVTSVGWNGAIAPGAAITSTGFCADRPNGTSSTALVVSTSATF